MWSVDYPKNNLESWADIHAFVASFPDDEYWSEWKPIAEGVISNLESHGLATFFRVGQSMHHIIFSTLDHHNLVDEPRVTIEFQAMEKLVHVAYSTSNLYFQPPVLEQCVEVPNAVSTVFAYLRRLWLEAKPNLPLPSPLAVT